MLLFEHVVPVQPEVAAVSEQSWASFPAHVALHSEAAPPGLSWRTQQTVPGPQLACSLHFSAVVSTTPASGGAQEAAQP
jgi:hypothetical protein